MRRIVVPFALAFRFFLSAGSNGTFWTVFRPIGFRQIAAAAEDAFFHVGPMKQSSAQASVQRQDGGAEPAAHQRICDTLRADTFLAIVQEQTIPAIMNNKALWSAKYPRWWLEEQPGYSIRTRYPQ